MGLAKPPVWLTVSVAAGGFLLLNWLERRRPLRKQTESKLRREARNVAVLGLSAVAVQLTEIPLVLTLTQSLLPRRWGIVRALELPFWIELPAALLLMDYTYYLWHVLLHRVPLLWRFHVVHHADLDMDASTALRFHFGEVLFTLPWRVGQVVLIGLTPVTYSAWQAAFLLSILFHHSDVELPVEWERRLNRFIVTPRMHGIHHSMVRQETNSNWSSGLTLWDRLHGTLRLNVPQTDVVIGVPVYRRPEQVTLPKIIEMPFRELPSVWELPGGGDPSMNDREIGHLVDLKGGDPVGEDHIRRNMRARNLVKLELHGCDDPVRFALEALDEPSDNLRRAGASIAKYIRVLSRGTFRIGSGSENSS
jgi:sterol desaturase/sphingolipid hydroxylase (fatty acid hydroxylase superfamily)